MVNVKPNLTFPLSQRTGFMCFKCLGDWVPLLSVASGKFPHRLLRREDFQSVVMQVHFRPGFTGPQYLEFMSKAVRGFGAGQIKQMKVNSAAGVTIAPSLTSTIEVSRDNEGSLRLDHSSGLWLISVQRYSERKKSNIHCTMSLTYCYFSLLLSVA